MEQLKGIGCGAKKGLKAFILAMLGVSSGAATYAVENTDGGYETHVEQGKSGALSVFGYSAITENLRSSIDFSSRGIHFGNRDEVGMVHALGLDLHKVFSSRAGDFGTLTLQGYLTRIDNLPVRPGFFDDNHDTEFVYRIVNFNYTGWGGKAPNIRIGHFEVPFGLEHTINTNGTLRDYNNGRNLGLKADWGATLNGETNVFEYEVSASTGGGQKVESQNGSYAYAARIGTLRENDYLLGFSVYKAEVGNIARERIGLDAQWYFGLHGLFAEFSLGENAGMDQLNGLLEWNIRNSNEAWFTYFQFVRFSQKFSGGWDDNLSGVVGLRYEPDAHWSFSGQVKQDITGFDGAIRETAVSLQIRYRL